MERARRKYFEGCKTSTDADKHSLTFSGFWKAKTDNIREGSSPLINVLDSRQKLVDFQGLIFAAAAREVLDFEAKEYVDEMQAPLENLTACIETLIAAQKHNVRGLNDKLLRAIFLNPLIEQVNDLFATALYPAGDFWCKVKNTVGVYRADKKAFGLLFKFYEQIQPNLFGENLPA